MKKKKKRFRDEIRHTTELIGPQDIAAMDAFLENAPGTIEALNALLGQDLTPYISPADDQKLLMLMISLLSFLSAEGVDVMPLLHNSHVMGHIRLFLQVTHQVGARSAHTPPTPEKKTGQEVGH